MNSFKIVIMLLLFLHSNNIFAQNNKWSLEKCIAYAKENNLQIKQLSYDADIARTNLNTVKNAYLPEINAGLSQRYHIDRTMNPYSGVYSKNNRHIGSVSVNAGIDIFEGFKRRNNVHAKDFSLKAVLFDIEKAKNNLSLNITSVFLELLFYDELIKNNSVQIEQTIDQVAIAKELVNSGIKTDSYLLDFFTQMAQDSLNLVVSKNGYQSKLIDLIQLLDIKDTNGFDIIIPKNLKWQPTANKAVDDYYNVALEVLPEIKSAQYRLQNAESNVKYIKGNRFPSLSFEGYCGTNYSSNSTLFNQQGEAIDYLYYNQLNDNINMYFGLRLTIPVFNRFSIRNSVNIAKINSSKMAANIQLTNQNVYQEVQKGYYDFIAAKEQMMSVKKLLDATELSHYHANEKLKAGIISVYDYGTVKTQLVKVTSQYLQAKYEYIFKMKILDFYTGIPISLEN